MRTLSAPKRTWLPSAVAGICFALSPFIVFVRYQGYSVWRPEILVCFAVLAAIGAIAGLLMETLGQYTRPLIFSILITITFDIQMTQPERTKLLWIVFAASLVITSWLRNHLARGGTVILTVLLVASFFAPQGPAVYNQQAFDEARPADPSLPIFLHIVLDGQIGVEGIPEEFDEDGRYAEALRDMYLDRGFHVFGRVFARFFNTAETMAKLFNFDTRGYDVQFHRETGLGFVLEKNAYFDLMRDRGYQIHVYQSEFTEYCGVDAPGPETASCFTQSVGAVSLIQDSGMPIVDKVRIIFGVFSRLSTILLDIRMPRIGLWPISSMGMLDRVREDVMNSAPGSMFFVHLLLPHGPYAYDADCRMREDPWTWLSNKKEGIGRQTKTFNDEASRAMAYPHYLEQVMCTNRKIVDFFEDLDEADMFQRMEIVVHSDHGSKIGIRLPGRRFGMRIAKDDYIDAFSSFFAYRKAGTAPSYDRRMLALGPLFTAVIRDGIVPDGVAWAGERKVYYKGAGPDKISVRKMPEFSRSLDNHQSDR
jgi:hypothetical protein